MSGSSSLLDQVRDLLERAAVAFEGTAQHELLAEVLARLDEPLRVAIAGKVKAGKSTLLNALVGEELAPTDEGECTRIVTWYRNGHTYRVLVEPTSGESRQVPFHRDAGAIEVDLGDTDAAEVERILIDWPSRSLERITLIDTPGIASLSTDVSARSHAFLNPDDERVTAADAVLYLMKHLHASDASFLEAFHDDTAAQATPINAIAVLSRADEVGAGRIDSMASARTIAERYRHDPKVRRLAQTVVPVAGLLAQSGSTLREVEFRALADLAGAPVTETDALFLSADRFVNADTSTGLTTLEREELMRRLGLFGIRLAIQLIREGQAGNSTDLARELVKRSGLKDLQAALLAQFAERRDVLKARSGLTAIDIAIQADPSRDSDGRLAADVERITAGAHELSEIQLLNSLRTAAVVPPPDQFADIERLLGTSGTSPAVRLGLDADADAGAVGQAAQEAMARWQQKAESPMSSQEMADAARVLVRTCEGILVSLT